MLRQADKILDDPLRSRFRTFWTSHSTATDVLYVGDAVLLAGVVNTKEIDGFNVSPLRYSPWLGFNKDPISGRTLNVNIDKLETRNFNVLEGDQIVCYGKAAWVSDHLRFREDAILNGRPSLATSMPFHAVHLFSGGYMGWSRAFDALTKTDLCVGAGSQIFVDHDPVVMECCAKTHGLTVKRGPSVPAICEWKPMKALCTAVGDVTICHHFDFLDNMVFTMSPPCVSWSRGGKRQGLNCAAGYAFQEAVELIEVSQPIAVFGECADTTPEHEHFSLVEASLKVIGYKRVWQQIVQAHTLTHNMRTRWLFTWIRGDVSGSPVDATFVLRAPPLTLWNSPSHSLWIPPSVSVQLSLPPRLVDFYSDIDFLPPAKRSRILSGCPNAVLHARVVSSTEPLPTLCSSYTKQHDLQTAHIRDKGVFGFLTQIDDEVRFVDPLRFIPIFGTMSKCVLPKTVCDAFHILGNAIIVPHALLCLCVGFSSLLDQSTNPVAEVARCWHQRLIRHHAIVQETEDFIVIWPWDDFCRQIKCAPLENVNFGLGVSISPAHSASCSMRLPVDFKGEDIAIHVLGIPAYMSSQISMSYECSTPVKGLSLRQMQRESHSWMLHMSNTIIAKIVIDPPCFVADVVPPTLPYTIESSSESDVSCETIVSCLPDFETLCDTPGFFDVLSVLDACACLQNWAHPQLSSFLLGWEDPPVMIECKVAAHCEPFLRNLLASTRFVGRFRVQKIPKMNTDRDAFVVLAEGTASTSALVILAAGTSPVSFRPCRVPSCLDSCVEVLFDSEPMRISHHNDIVVETGVPIQTVDADVLSLVPKQELRCGGHPTSIRIPPLANDATFLERCEWATNTFGWAATDELHYALQQCTEGTETSIVVTYWNKEQAFLETGPFGQPDFREEGTTWCAILLDHHWIAADVHKHGDKASIDIRGTDPQTARLIAHEIARRIDLHPQRVPFSVTPNLMPDDMCGWEALFFWFRARSCEYVLPDFDGFLYLEENLQDAIWQVMNASFEEWQNTQASTPVRNFAWAVRFNFMVSLASLDCSLSQSHEGPLVATTSSQDAHPPTPRSEHNIVPCMPTCNASGSSLVDRLTSMSSSGGLLASDLLDDLMDLLRHNRNDILFSPPAYWNPQQNTFRFFNDFTCDFRPFHHIHLPVLSAQWIHCEIMRTQHHALAIIIVPQQDIQLPTLALHIARCLDLPPECLHVTALQSSHTPDIAGWTHLLHLFYRYGAQLPQPSPAQHYVLAHHQHADLIAEVMRHAHHDWGRVAAPADVRIFATRALSSFLFKLVQNKGVQHYAAGGAADSSNTTDKKQPTQPTQGNQDPWLKTDPWQPKKKAPQTRWEDLLLLDDHPFRTKEDQVIQQVHRLQAGTRFGGLILTTKAHLEEISQLKAKSTLAAILPALDTNTVKGHDIGSLGPYEVILKDPGQQTTYKRLVSVVVFHGDVTYKLQNPAHVFKTEAVAEIVLELDSRLVPKEEFEAAKTNASAVFKRILQENIPSIAPKATLYGFRSNKHPSANKDELQIQCVMKIPASERKEVLQISGMCSLLARDFLDKGSSQSDTSILPKFWPPSARDLRELVIASNDIPGKAGLALTRRGLALRVWSDQIGKARKEFIPEDNRITKLNMDTVPRFTFEASGWPSGLEPHDVIQSTHKATGLAPVPTRTYRAAGVHTWVLAFQEKPKTEKFIVQINTAMYEVLLKEAPVQAWSKGSGKGKNQSKKSDVLQPGTPAPQVTMFHTDKQRLDQLESRFDKLGQVSNMEERQGVFERKIDSRFSDISDSLRQLLQQSHPRARDQSGDTPPPKQPKV